MATAHHNPFRSYNRLEPQAREEDFERSLRCEVHDPLWLLGRQWQFGEFQGEDAGSAIFAKVLMETAPLLKYELPGGQTLPYAQELPFETVVERFGRPEDYRDCTYGAQRFLQLLDARLKGEPGYQKDFYVKKLQLLFPLSLPALAPGDTPEQQVTKLQLLTNEKLVAFLSAAQHWTFNALRLYRKIVSDTPFVVSSMVQTEAHRAKLTQIVGQFKTWYEQKYPNLAANAWMSEALEHRLAVAAPSATGNNTVLQASEYAQGELEWYHFDKADPKTISAALKTSTAAEKQKISAVCQTLLPSSARYSGMPASRWWEFENGSVNLSLATAAETDLARLITAQYALQYSNDWLVVPFLVPNGSLAEIKGIVVTDTFGMRTLIRPAAQGQTANWQSWGLFNLSGPLAYEAADVRTLMPPVAPPALRGDPVESVALLRDEMANMVWGIETLVPDQLGRGQDGHRAAQTLAERLLVLDPSSSAKVSDETIKGAVLRYTLATSVPENWIPFTPAQLPNQQRAIRLQRASMPRWFAGDYSRIRPRTLLLRPGMYAQTSNTDDLPAADAKQQEQEKAYFINEEEVTRAGVRVEAFAKRTRWYNGAIVYWMARRKTSGRGEANSGLAFDALTWEK